MELKAEHHRDRLQITRQCVSALRKTASDVVRTLIFRDVLPVRGQMELNWNYSVCGNFLHALGILKYRESFTGGYSGVSWLCPGGKVVLGAK